MLRQKMQIAAVLLLAGFGLFAEVKVKDVTVKPRWPWNGKVDIIYSIECDEKDQEGKPAEVYVSFRGTDNDRNTTFNLRYLTGDGARTAVTEGGPYTVTWDASKDRPELNSSSFAVSVSAIAGIASYLVVDLSGGPNAASYPYRYSAAEPDLADDTCRTTELWLRQIPAGTFTMGSPANEVGRYSYDMAQHQVTITQMFYIGVFECTQKQWELVMGSNPSYYKGDCRPVEQVFYNMIRGTGAQAGAGWPTYGHAVDGTSFLGKLQSKTGLTFDLPTEAQWEYACRLRADGTCWTTALNSGKNLTSTSSCPNMAEVGRYYYNQNDGKGGYSQHTKVGSYRPSEMGLYDMHGNVWEWCLDWWGANLNSTAAETDPVGPAAGSRRLLRGGYWSNSAGGCCSAGRSSYYPSYGNNDGRGFRVACLPVVQ